MSRALRYGLLVAVALSGVFLFVLASASGNTAFFERHYPVLLAINGVIAAALAILVLMLVGILGLRRWITSKQGPGKRRISRLATNAPSR